MADLAVLVYALLDGANKPHLFFLLIYESSSTFTVPKGVKKIDVFCVGGGCGGFSARSDGNTSDGYADVGGGGGGGGYTSTKLGADVTPGQQLSVVVGSAGSASSVGDICNAEGQNIKIIIQML